MKYAILSTDNTPEYFQLLPLVCYSWRKIGYESVIICVNADHVSELLRKHLGIRVYSETSRDGVKDSTMAQLLRLYQCHDPYIVDNDILLTSDADMVIAKDIFHCNDGFTNYGYDLTGRSELPICYNIATAKVWKEMMGEFNVPETAYSEQWESYWSTDQKYLTERATIYGFHRITFVNRGNQNKHGLPTGRWDRFDWSYIPENIIDVHMLRNNWDAQIQVFQRLWPGEDYSFILKFKEALNEPVR
jgi:hypothetical protein